MVTVDELVDRARAAYEALVVVGEEIDDEWQYIADLSAAWLAQLDRLAVDHGDRVVPPETVAAIDWLIGEIGRLSDAHRAIDWLSTFPQAVLLALEPAEAAGSAGP